MTLQQLKLKREELIKTMSDPIFKVCEELFIKDEKGAHLLKYITDSFKEPPLVPALNAPTSADQWPQYIQASEFHLNPQRLAFIAGQQDVINRMHLMSKYKARTEKEIVELDAKIREMEAEKIVVPTINDLLPQ